MIQLADSYDTKFFRPLAELGVVRVCEHAKLYIIYKDYTYLSPYRSTRRRKEEENEEEKADVTGFISSTS